MTLIRKRHSHFPWQKPCAMNPEHKERFHQEARTRLELLVAYMQWPPESYEFRFDPIEIRVSGKTILHHSTIYIEVSQPWWGKRSFILLRACAGIDDEGAGLNFYSPYHLLENIPDFGTRVREIRGEIPLRKTKPVRKLPFTHVGYWNQDRVSWSTDPISDVMKSNKPPPYHRLHLNTQRKVNRP